MGGGDLAAIIEGRNYEIIYRIESGDCRGGRLCRADNRRHGPGGIAEAKPVIRTGPGRSDYNISGGVMKFAEKIEEAGATGYILLWLLGIPIPILLVIFLLRGCT